MVKSIKFISFVSETFILSLFWMAVGPLYNVSKLVCKGYVSLISVNKNKSDREDVDSVKNLPEIVTMLLLQRVLQ